VANLFAPRAHVAQPPPVVDLTPVHTQITELQVQHQDLRTQMVEQTSSLKRVEDQLEMVREATDRNTLEQQELIEDLKAVGNKVNLFALLLFAMLIVSLVLNVMLFLHIKQVLP
jgi:septal ring factor EnvC (AmiA/AmiB activator)